MDRSSRQGSAATPTPSQQATDKADPRLGRALVGRQAILDRNRSVWAYELLYRAPDPEWEDLTNPQVAVGMVILNTFVEIGLERVAGDHRLLIEFPRHQLLETYTSLLPSDRVVLQIPVFYKNEVQVSAVLRFLRSRGFRIGLSGFMDSNWEEIPLNLVNVITLDAGACADADLKRAIGYLRLRGVPAIASGVDTPARYQICRNLGFEYFKGKFLDKPQTIEQSRSPSNLRKTLELLRALGNPQATVDDIERIVVTDVAFSYRLLRCLNSAAFARPSRIDSVRQAIVMLGFDNLRKWATVLAVSAQTGKPIELMRMALVRAQMCEGLARITRQSNARMFFTVGFFSVLDALLDRPLPEVIAELPLTPEVSAAVLAHEGFAGEVLSCVIAYERGDWDQAQLPSVTRMQVRDAWLRAVREADAVVADLVT